MARQLPFKRVNFVDGGLISARCSDGLNEIPAARLEAGRCSGLSGPEAKQFYESCVCQASPGPFSCAPCNRKPSENVVSCLNRGKTKISGSENGSERRTRTYSVDQFLKAAADGDLRTVKQCFISGTDVNVVDQYRWTALMCAAFAGQKDVVKLLLRRKADRRLTNQRGKTAYDLAADQHHWDIVLLLANVKERKTDSSTSTDGRPNTHLERGGSGERVEATEEANKYCEDCHVHFRSLRHYSTTAHLFKTWSVRSQPCFGIPRSNRGYKLMMKSGWNESSGLGPQGEGRHYPLKTLLKRDRKGLGLPTAQKPRVTHFQPFDDSAILNRWQSKPLKVQRKRDLEYAERKRKRAEREFRREFY